MTVKMFRRLVVVFALASVLVACDGSPIAATPQRVGSTATNFGGPLPCTYLPPAESYVSSQNRPKQGRSHLKPQEGRGLRLGGVWCLRPTWTRRSGLETQSLPPCPFTDGDPIPIVLVLGTRVARKTNIILA